MSKNTVRTTMESGFTFVELLLVMALIGVMTGFLASLFRSSVFLFQNQDLEIQVIEEANYLNSFMLENLRDAEGVETTITDGSDTFTSGSDEIIVRLPAIDGSSNPIPGIYDYYVMYQSSSSPGDLRWRLIPAGSSNRVAFDKLAGEEITAMSFSYDTMIPAEASFVTVTFTLEKSNSFRTIDISRSTSVNLRNQ